MPPLEPASRFEQLAFFIHGLVTLAAGIVLAAFPAAIPASVGIAMEPRDYLLSYFLAAAEIGIALLSIGAARLHDAAARRLIAMAFAVFHGATAIFELVHLAGFGFSPVLAVNVAVRVGAAGLFVFLWRAHRH